MRPEPTDPRENEDAIDKATDAQGLADLNAGRIVSGEAVKRWLRTWGTNDHRPRPKMGD
jgi:predicted transcriptional regulator